MLLATIAPCCTEVSARHHNQPCSLKNLSSVTTGANCRLSSTADKRFATAAKWTHTIIWKPSTEPCCREVADATSLWRMVLDRCWRRSAMSAQMSHPQCYKPVCGGCDIKTVSSAVATKKYRIQLFSWSCHIKYGCRGLKGKKPWLNLIIMMQCFKVCPWTVCALRGYWLMTESFWLIEQGIINDVK